MTKEDIIRETYGDYWQIVKNDVDENGWMDLSFAVRADIGEIGSKTYEFKDLVQNHERCRIISLSGLEENNGWTKIKNGNSITLPEYKKGDIYEIYNIETESSYPCRFTAKEVKQQFDYKHITHYKLVERTKFPIY